MKTEVLLKNFIVFSPIVIPFSGIPLVGLGFFHLTVLRAYLLGLILSFVIVSFAKSRFHAPSGRGALIYSLLFLYGLLLYLSIFWSNNLSRALEYNLYYFWYLTFLGVFLSSRLEKKDLESFFNVWVMTGALIAFICFIEITFEVRFPGSRYFYEESQWRFIPTATFSNENNLAIYLAITTVLALGKVSVSRLFLSLIIWLTLVWVLFVVLLTGSRGGVVVLLLGGGGYLFFRTKWSPKQFLKALLVLLLITVVITVSDLAGMIAETTSQIVNAIDDGDARVPLLKNSILAMQENYFMGVGAGGIEEYMSKFNVGVLAVHNWIGEIAANTGVLGILLWFFILILLASWLFSKRSYSKVYSYPILVILFIFPLWQSIVSSMIQFSAFWFFIAASLKFLDLKSYRDLNTPIRPG